MGFAEEEEQKKRVEVTLWDGGREGRRRECGVAEEEAVEGGEEVAGDEEGLLREGERVEVAEGCGKEGWGGEDGGEAAVVAVAGGDEGVGQMGEVRGTEGGECSHDACNFFHYGILCSALAFSL